MGTRCRLIMRDAHGDGWAGATWKGLGVELTLIDGFYDERHFIVSAAWPPPPPTAPRPPWSHYSDYYYSYTYDAPPAIPPPSPRPPRPPLLPPSPVAPPRGAAPACTAGLCLRERHACRFHGSGWHAVTRVSRDGRALVAGYAEWLQWRSHTSLHGAWHAAVNASVSWLRLYALDATTGYYPTLTHEARGVHTDAILTIDIDASSTFVVSGGRDGTLALHRWPSRTHPYLKPVELIHLPGHDGYPARVRHARFAPPPPSHEQPRRPPTRLLLEAYVWGGANRLELRELPSLALIASTAYANPNAYRPAMPEWSADGALIAGTTQRKLRLWDARDLRVVAQSGERPVCGGGMEAPIVATAFVPAQSETAGRDLSDASGASKFGRYLSAAGNTLHNSTHSGTHNSSTVLVATLEACVELAAADKVGDRLHRLSLWRYSPTDAATLRDQEGGTEGAGGPATLELVQTADLADDRTPNPYGTQPMYRFAEGCGGARSNVGTQLYSLASSADGTTLAVASRSCRLFLFRASDLTQLAYHPSRAGRYSPWDTLGAGANTDLPGNGFLSSVAFVGADATTVMSASEGGFKLWDVWAPHPPSRPPTPRLPPAPPPSSPPSPPPSPLPPLPSPPPPQSPPPRAPHETRQPLGRSVTSETIALSTAGGVVCVQLVAALLVCMARVARRERARQSLDSRGGLSTAAPTAKHEDVTFEVHSVSSACSFAAEREAVPASGAVNVA